MTITSIMMLAGGLIFALGFGLKFTGRSPRTADKVAVDEEITSITASDTVNKLIELAVADGVVTPNEKRMIRKECVQAGIDPEQVFAALQTKLQKSQGEAETKIRDVHKENGTKFEGYVAKKFKQNRLKLLVWAGDKYVDGIYDETTKEPDLKYKLSTGEGYFLFAIECKWRKDIRQMVDIARPEQLKNYQSYENRTGAKTFIVLGIGGTADDPKSMYIIPVENLTQTKFTPDQLQRYYQSGKGNFFYDGKKEMLGIFH